MVKFEFNRRFIFVKNRTKKQEKLPIFFDFMLKLLKISRYKK